MRCSRSERAGNLKAGNTSGLAAMPSTCSKLAPIFSRGIKDPIEEFLQEYEELADNHWLTHCQKVEMVI